MAGYEGSPPLTRGKGGQGISLRSISGITPAYAGKRDAPLSFARCGRDHPRLRGEKYAITRSRLMRAGSPPLTRGKVLTGTEPTATLRDHPLLRGEKAEKRGYFFQVEGSPPLTRGKDRK